MFILIHSDSKFALYAYNRVPTHSGNQGKPGKWVCTFPVRELMKFPKSGINQGISFFVFLTESEYLCLFVPAEWYGNGCILVDDVMLFPLIYYYLGHHQGASL